MIQSSVQRKAKYVKTQKKEERLNEMKNNKTGNRKRRRKEKSPTK